MQDLYCFGELRTHFSDLPVYCFAPHLMQARRHPEPAGRRAFAMIALVTWHCLPSVLPQIDMAIPTSPSDNSSVSITIRVDERQLQTVQTTAYDSLAILFA